MKGSSPVYILCVVSHAAGQGGYPLCHYRWSPQAVNPKEWLWLWNLSSLCFVRLGLKGRRKTGPPFAIPGSTELEWILGKPLIRRKRMRVHSWKQTIGVSEWAPNVVGFPARLKEFPQKPEAPRFGVDYGEREAHQIGFKSCVPRDDRSRNSKKGSLLCHYRGRWPSGCLSYKGPLLGLTLPVGNPQFKIETWNPSGAFRKITCLKTAPFGWFRHGGQEGHGEGAKYCKFTLGSPGFWA